MSLVRQERDGDLLFLTLDNPSKANALSPALAAEPVLRLKAGTFDPAEAAAPGARSTHGREMRTGVASPARGLATLAAHEARIVVVVSRGLRGCRCRLGG